jgi:hypothetical protein
MGLRFTQDAHAAVADGTITVTYRAWKRPQVKIGGHYRVGAATVEVSAIELVGRDAVPEDGLAWIGDAETVYRVEFHPVTPRPAKPPLAFDEITKRLDRMDARSAVGPWTDATLRVIRDHPGVVSTTLAELLGRERFELKADVRKLKALGLTESLEVGYRLSPLGEAYLSDR